MFVSVNLLVHYSSASIVATGLDKSTCYWLHFGSYEEARQKSLVLRSLLDVMHDARHPPFEIPRILSNGASLEAFWRNLSVYCFFKLPQLFCWCRCHMEGKLHFPEGRKYIPCSTLYIQGHSRKIDSKTELLMYHNTGKTCYGKLGIRAIVHWQLKMSMFYRRPKWSGPISSPPVDWVR